MRAQADRAAPRRAGVFYLFIMFHSAGQLEHAARLPVECSCSCRQCLNRLQALQLVEPSAGACIGKQFAVQDMQGCSPSRKRHKADDWPRAALQQDGDVVTVTVRLPASALQHASLPSGLLSAGLSTELATSAAGVLEWLAYKLEGLGPEQSPGQRLLQVRPLHRRLSIAVKDIERRCTCTLPPHSSACMLWDCNVGIRLLHTHCHPSAIQ